MIRDIGLQHTFNCSHSTMLHPLNVRNGRQVTVSLQEIHQIGRDRRKTSYGRGTRCFVRQSGQVELPRQRICMDVRRLQKTLMFNAWPAGMCRLSGKTT